MKGAAARHCIALDDFPFLAEDTKIQLEQITGQSVLLFPNGMLILNRTGLVILSLCDGRRSFAQILDELSQQCNLPPEELRGDVGEYLRRLHARRLLMIRCGTRRSTRGVKRQAMHPIALQIS